MRMDEKIKIQLPFFNQDLLTHFFLDPPYPIFKTLKIDLNWF